MNVLNIINNDVSSKHEDGREIAIANLKDEFRRSGIDKDEAVLSMLYDELLDPKRIGIFELTFQLEVLTDTLFTLLIKAKAFTEEEAKNLWRAIQKDENGSFEEFYSLLKSVLKKEK